MPAAAAVLKTLLLSLSVLTALSLAVLETNPQVRAWVEAQRARVAELLRGLGEELDPESRRQAEAFVFSGSNHDMLRREGDAVKREGGSVREEGEEVKREIEGAVGVTTGRVLSGSPGAVRRVPVVGVKDAGEAEERKRRGREYLARREKMMREVRERRKGSAVGGEEKKEEAVVPATPASFDTLVDQEGKLKGLEMLEAAPMVEPEMRERERQLVQPVTSGGFERGAQLADPFGDEYAMYIDRSGTPKPPPVPPKVALDSPRNVESDTSVDAQTQHEELSYEEQLAIALSLSEADSAAEQERDDGMEAAIAASLAQQQESPSQSQPLVDLTPSTSTSDQRTQGHLIDFSPTDLLSPPPPASEASEDELYRITPQLTRARLATLEESLPSTTSTTATYERTPYDPVHEAADSHSESQNPPVASPFYSAPSSVVPSHTMSGSGTPQLIDAEPSTAAPSTVGFETDTDDSEAFASVMGGGEEIEVVDVDTLSDDEGDGIATPDSWTEVGSRDGESSDDDNVPVGSRL